MRVWHAKKMAILTFDDGLNDRSIFTWNVLQDMSCLAGLDKNNIITASELGV